MDDTTLIRYENLGTVDSRVTCVASASKTLFLGNSYGDIILVKRDMQEVLHNHSGEITSLVGRRCGRRGMENGVYLLTGTSIGNVYLHLAFPENITRSRILYKFVAVYPVLAMCPHPEFEVFNLKRVSSRLTIDFTEEVSTNSNSWNHLQTTSISVESFIVSLGNGVIYLVTNSRCQKYENGSKNNLENEKYIIMYITTYSPQVNVKMNWNINYLSIIDGEGFCLFKMPTFESILFIPKEYFSNQMVKREEKIIQRIEERKNHYLYNIIDNNELYVSTEESDINPNNKSIEDVNNIPNSKNNKSEVKKIERNLISYRTIKKGKNWGTMSRLISDSILVGWNNIILYIKLVEENNEDFRGHEHLFINTYPDKEEITYNEIKNKIKKGRRSKGVVRGYIDYKLVMPKNLKILNIVNNDNSQFNLVMWEMEEEVNKDDECYTCEKYNSDGTVYKYKLRPPEEREIKKQKEKGKVKIVNMVFNIDQKNYSIRSLGILYSESVKIGQEKEKREKDLLLTESTIRNENQDDVYMWANKVIMHINYSKNYIKLLKYYMSNSYSKRVVVDHFKGNLEYLIKNKKQNDEKKYIIEYIKTFIGYVMEREYYKGVKVVAKILGEQGKLDEYLNEVFTEELRGKLEEKGCQEYLLEEITNSEKGSNLPYMEMLTWNLKPELAEIVLSKSKNVVLNHIVQERKISQKLEKQVYDERSNNFSTEMSKNDLQFMNNLKNFNKKEEVTAEDLYDVLYEFLHLGNYERRFSDTFERNSIKKNLNCLIYDEGEEDVKDDSEKESEEVNRLEMCRVETELLNDRLKALKYYQKYLNDKFLLLNTRGLMYTKKVRKKREEDERYIEKSLVSCTICQNCRANCEAVKNGLFNRVEGGALTQPKVSNILYFGCNHMVHEKCQISLINQITSLKNATFVVPGKHPIFESTKLLDICLICLVSE